VSEIITGVRGAQVQRGGQGGRWYIWQRDRYWGVTTIIGGGIPKPVLVNWAKKFTAEYAIEHHRQLAVMIEHAQTPADRQGVIDWLKNAAYRDRDQKANLGSIIHDIAEAHVIGRPYPSLTEEQAPFVETFKTFLADFTPTFVAVEMPVFNRQYLYAGTLDSIMDIPLSVIGECALWGEPPVDRDYWRILVDYKTGASGPWPEVAIQNSAYRNAEFVGLPNDREAPMPVVDGTAVLKIRPEGYELYPLRSDQDVFDTFLYAREVYRWGQEIAKTVMGTQMISEYALGRGLEQSLEGAAAPASVPSETVGEGDQSAEPSANLGSAGGTIAQAQAPSPAKPRKPRAKKATT
jgi:hypothetical protein